MGKRRRQAFQDEDDGDSSTDNESMSEHDNASDSEFKQFGVTAVDLEAEAALLDPSRRTRSRKHHSKESAIYGVFADDDDDDDPYSANRSGSSRRNHKQVAAGKRKQFLDTSGVAFVKSSAVASNKQSAGNDHDSEDDDGMNSDANAQKTDDRDAEDDQYDTGRHPNIQDRATKQKDHASGTNHRNYNDSGNNDDEDEDVDDGRPSFGGAGLGSFGSNDWTTMPPKQLQPQPQTQPEPYRAAKPVKVDKDFAKFEQHTKGFGLKMLKKFGYVPGQGLGADGSGIVQPIDVKLRPTGKGLGHGGFDERTEAVKRQLKEKQRQEAGTLSDESSGSESDNVSGTRQKKTKSKAKKPAKQDGWKQSVAKLNKPRYKTAQDLLAEQLASEGVTEPVSTAAAAAAAAPTKIIDMTSKETRVLSSMSQISISAVEPEPAGRLPELRHNVRLVADLAKSDLLHVSRKIRIEASHKARIQSDVKALQVFVEDETNKLDRLRRIQTLVNECRSQSAAHAKVLTGATVDPSAVERLFGNIFRELQTRFLIEYKAFALDGLVVATILPVFKSMLAQWSPLTTPTHGVQVLRSWKSLLVTSASQSTTSATDLADNTDSTESAGIMTPFESMLYTVWLPKVRQAINNDWDVKQPDPVIELLEAWYPPASLQQQQVSLLPPWLFSNIANQLIMPKLASAVQNWNPLSDPVPVHTWLHPWLPVLGDMLETLWTEVRRKLEHAWRDWKPRSSQPPASGLSHIQTLKTWIPVFSEKDFDHILTTTILPGLISHLRREFTISPANQDLSPLIDDVFPWRAVIPAHLFSQLLATEFFDKWSEILWIWIASPEADLDEVTNWYLSWKQVFEDAGMSDLDAVKEGWRSALDMMNQGLTLRKGGAMPSEPLPPYRSHKPESASASASESASIASSTRLVTPQVTFKDYVESVAAERNIPFVPLNRDHPRSGKPLFRLGKKLQVYIDNGVLFVPPATQAASQPASDSRDLDWMFVSVDEAMARALSAK